MVNNRSVPRISMLMAIILTLGAVPLLAVGSVKADPGAGSGVLFIYNADGTNRAPNPSSSPPYSIDVDIGETITFQIRYITESLTSPIWVYVQFTLPTDNTSWVKTYSGVALRPDSPGQMTVNLTWTVGIFDEGDLRADMQFCMTGIVTYRQTNSGEKLIAQNQIAGQGSAHWHAIPEVPFGTLTTALTMIGGLGIFALKRKRF